MPISSNRPQWSSRPEPKGPAEQLNELKDLIVGYAKQETIDPLKALGRMLGFGIAGAIMIGTGLLLGLLALLRGLQSIEVFNDPTMTTGGTWSWVPYAITFVVGLVLAVIFLVRLIKALQGTDRSSEPGGDPVR